jgi:two-component system, sensor histidine kinase and response regulator
MPTRILLIDDDQVDRAFVRLALAKSGLMHDLTEAVDGASGLGLAQTQFFDCVLLDYCLPDVDTFELLASLLSPDGGKQTVLMLTGESDQKIALRLVRAGALDYLAKSEMTPRGLARAIRYANARREALAKLEAAHREAQEKSVALDMLNRQKTLLFSIIAHDLRNPFQTILGLSSLLSQAVASRDHAFIERRAQGVREAAEQAHGLMESLFAWADLQMDTTAVPSSDVDLADVADETVRGVRVPAANKEIRILASCATIHVHTHRGMLATVLRNLVSNAIKFTQPGGSVTITGRPYRQGVEISVSDTGIGIPSNQLANLFRRDRRTTSNGTAGERGSGFGLLLCRDLVERLGGELVVCSTVGVGTTFLFVLPGSRGASRIDSDDATV